MFLLGSQVHQHGRDQYLHVNKNSFYLTVLRVRLFVAVGGQPRCCVDCRVEGPQELLSLVVSPEGVLEGICVPLQVLLQLLQYQAETLP